MFFLRSACFAVVQIDGRLRQKSDAVWKRCSTQALVKIFTKIDANDFTVNEFLKI